MTTANLVQVSSLDDVQHGEDATSPYAHTFLTGQVAIRLGNLNGILDVTGLYKLSGSYRYINVPMLREATISAATMTFNAGETQTSANVNLTIDADDADDSARITSDAEWDAIAKTAASVAWSGVGIWTQNATTNATTPESKTVVQEVIDRAGWISNQALTMFVHDDGNNSAFLSHRLGWAKLTGPAPSNWPHLDIDYTGGLPDPSVSAFVPRVMMY